MKRFIKIALFAIALLSTTSIFAQKQEIRVFSHRGGRMEFDENTMAAFQASYDAGYRGFEVDIRLTKDGEMVFCRKGEFTEQDKKDFYATIDKYR